MSERKGLLLVLMEPPASLEEEFNDWYDTEHFPQRRALPGMESATRWVCLSGWPRWAALYDMAGLETLQTPEYLAVSGANSTPWSRRILPRTVGRARLVLEQVAPGGALGLPPPEVSALVLARYPGAIDPAACLEAAATVPGCRQARVFRSAAIGPAQSFVLAEYSRPAGSGRVAETLGEVAGTGATLRERPGVAHPGGGATGRAMARLLQLADDGPIAVGRASGGIRRLASYSPLRHARPWRQRGARR